MPVRGSLASLAMATTGCPPGHIKDANGVCQWVYVPELEQMPPPYDPGKEDTTGGEPIRSDYPPPIAPPTAPPIDPPIVITTNDPPPDYPPDYPPENYPPDYPPELGQGQGQDYPRTPYSALGTIQYPRDATGLVDYIQDWERPGWTTSDFRNAGLFKIGAQLATTDPGGYFGDNKYPGVPVIRNNWAERQRLLQEQIAIMSPKGTEGRPQFPGPFEGDEARTARLKEVQDLRSDLMEQQQAWRLQDYNQLFKIGTPYETTWNGGSVTGDNWKVAPEAGEPFGGWGIYSGGVAGSFLPAKEDGLLGMVGDGGSSDGITTPLPSIPPPSPMPMPIPIPDNSLPPPIEEYNQSPHGAGSADQFESFLQSLKPGTYTHESVLQDFLGRPPNAKELYMLDLRNNEFNMPVIDPTRPGWEPPKNNDGLLGIVGGGLVDPTQGI